MKCDIRKLTDCAQAGTGRAFDCFTSSRSVLKCGQSSAAFGSIANSFIRIIRSAATLFAVACIAFIQSAQAKLNVVATTPDLAAIAKEIGKDHIDITTLAKPTEDPHFVDA